MAGHANADNATRFLAHMPQPFPAQQLLRQLLEWQRSLLKMSSDRSQQANFPRQRSRYVCVLFGTGCGPYNTILAS